MLRRGRKPAFQIHLIVTRIVLPCEMNQALPRVSPYGIEHLAADTKFCITREGDSGFRAERSRRLQQADVPRLNQIGYLNAAPARKTRVHSPRERSHKAAHFFSDRRFQRPFRAYARDGPIRDL